MCNRLTVARHEHRQLIAALIRTVIARTVRVSVRHAVEG
jgi:hypothetical protein